MKIKEAGSTIYVIGSKVQFNEYNRNVLVEIENVRVVHLTDGKQLRGRTPNSKKRFIVLDPENPLADSVSKYKRFLDHNNLRVQVVERAERDQQADNALNWFRTNVMGKKVEPVETA